MIGYRLLVLQSKGHCTANMKYSALMTTAQQMCCIVTETV